MFEGDWADIIPVRGLSQTTISKKKRGLVKKKGVQCNDNVLGSND